jgi:hypothetical protein
MFRRGLVLVSVALVSLATSAAGQSIAPLRLGVALGTSFGESERWRPGGGHAALSLTSQGAGSRFGLRVEAIFDHTTRNYDGSSHYRWQTSTMALTINTTYRLLGRTTGLYAIGGIGVYQRWNELRILDFRTGEEMRTSTNAGIDANLGLGYNFTAFGRELFVETRLYGTTFFDRVPLSLGIRF